MIVGRITGRVLEEPKSVRSLEEVPRRPALRGRQWYLVHSVGRDRLVRDCLRNARFESYYPQQRVMQLVPQRELSKKQRASRIPILRAVLRPLLPGYLFVFMDLEHDRWHDLFDLIGLFGIICSDDGSKPYPLEPAIVTTLRAKEIDGAIPGGIGARGLAFEVGEQVRISGGSWAGHNAVVDRIPDSAIEGLDESTVVGLLLQAFGRWTPVEVLVSDIEKL